MDGEGCGVNEAAEIDALLAGGGFDGVECDWWGGRRGGLNGCGIWLCEIALCVGGDESCFLCAVDGVAKFSTANVAD